MQLSLFLTIALLVLTISSSEARKNRRRSRGQRGNARERGSTNNNNKRRNPQNDIRIDPWQQPTTETKTNDVCEKGGSGKSGSNDCERVIADGSSDTKQTRSRERFRSRNNAKEILRNSFEDLKMAEGNVNIASLQLDELNLQKEFEDESLAEDLVLQMIKAEEDSIRKLQQKQILIAEELKAEKVERERVRLRIARKDAAIEEMRLKQLREEELLDVQRIEKENEIRLAELLDIEEDLSSAEDERLERVRIQAEAAVISENTALDELSEEEEPIVVEGVRRGRGGGFRNVNPDDFQQDGAVRQQRGWRNGGFQRNTDGGGNLRRSFQRDRQEAGDNL